MKELTSRVYIGNLQDAETLPFYDWAVVHACKDPCYTQVAGKSLSKDSPDYLWIEANKQLYLNMIDPPIPLFKLELFHKALDFIEKHWWNANDGICDTNILIHCNQGLSRAPTIGMIWISHYLNLIEPKQDPAEIMEIFRKEFYPDYKPGKGIEEFVLDNWLNFAPEGRKIV